MAYQPSVNTKVDALQNNLTSLSDNARELLLHAESQQVATVMGPAVDDTAMQLDEARTFVSDDAEWDAILEGVPNANLIRARLAASLVATADLQAKRTAEAAAEIVKTQITGPIEIAANKTKAFANETNQTARLLAAEALGAAAAISPDRAKVISNYEEELAATRDILSSLDKFKGQLTRLDKSQTEVLLDEDKTDADKADAVAKFSGLRKEFESQ